MDVFQGCDYIWGVATDKRLFPFLPSNLGGCYYNVVSLYSDGDLITCLLPGPGILIFPYSTLFDILTYSPRQYLPHGIVVFASTVFTFISNLGNGVWELVFNSLALWLARTTRQGRWRNTGWALVFHLVVVSLRKYISQILSVLCWSKQLKGR